MTIWKFRARCHRAGLFSAAMEKRTRRGGTMIRIARGYHAVIACLFALISASCATTDSQSGAVADNTLSQDEAAQLAAELQRQVLSCWNPPGVNVNAVTVDFRLNRDGSLAGEPTLVKAASGAQHSQAIAETALRAVRDCAPFKLPAVSYEWWQEVEVKFDATRMFSSTTLRRYEQRLSGQTGAQP